MIYVLRYCEITSNVLIVLVERELENLVTSVAQLASLSFVLFC